MRKFIFLVIVLFTACSPTPGTIPPDAINTAIAQTMTADPTKIVQLDGMALGSPDAPVLVEVWEDFQCPACRMFTEDVEPLVIDTYVASGKVRYVFHHYPFLDDRVDSKESDQAANASMCAAEQERFWDYHDTLFANWQGENQGAFDDSQLIAHANTLGLDMNSFISCFIDNRYKEQIDKDMADGNSAGVTGTPKYTVK